MIEAARPGVLHMVTEAVTTFYRRHAWGLASVFMWAVGAGFIAYYGWLEKPMMTYEGTPFVLVGTPGSDGHAVVRMGAVIAFETIRCNHSGAELDYTTSREIVPVDVPLGPDGREQRPVRLETASSTLFKPNGCEPSTSSRIRAPEVGARPGLYYLHGTAKVPGTWRTAPVPWRTQTFRLLPKEAP